MKPLLVLRDSRIEYTNKLTTYRFRRNHNTCPIIASNGKGFCKFQMIMSWQLFIHQVQSDIGVTQISTHQPLRQYKSVKMEDLSPNQEMIIKNGGVSSWGTSSYMLQATSTHEHLVSEDVSCDLYFVSLTAFLPALS